MKKSVTFRNQFNVAGVKPLVFSIEHGYLWVGSKDRCVLHASGPKTLKKLARMLIRYAR